MEKDITERQKVIERMDKPRYREAVMEEFIYRKRTNGKAE